MYSPKTQNFKNFNHLCLCEMYFWYLLFPLNTVLLKSIHIYSYLCSSFIWLHYNIPLCEDSIYHSSFILLRVSEMIPSEFYKTFKEDIITILYKFLQRVEKEGILSKVFSATNITLKLNQKGHAKKEKSQIHLTHEYEYKYSKQNIIWLNSTVQTNKQKWNQVGSLPSFHELILKMYRCSSLQ